jgi:hypothetical protein
MEDKIVLRLSVDQVNTVLSALAAGTYQTVAPVIEDIRSQAIPQLGQVQKSDKVEAEPVDE